MTVAFSVVVASMPDEPLPAAAQTVWIAYEQMAATKHRHFEYLRYLEEKYHPYGQASTAEQARLSELLSTHDAQVETFRGLLAQLRIEDSAAYAALLQRLVADSA